MLWSKKDENAGQGEGAEEAQENDRSKKDRGFLSPGKDSLRLLHREGRENTGKGKDSMN